MNIYQTKKVTESLTLVYEDLEPVLVMGLVEGKEKAAIVDTGMGLTGDLDKFLTTLTDKPIVCIVTHGDPDHAAGAALFDPENVYMSEKDDILLPWALSHRNRFLALDVMCSGNRELIDYAHEHITPSESFKHQDLMDGQVFDLGGVKLTAIATPGHSQGSMCLVNQEENYVMGGDSIVYCPWLWLDRCPPLKEYRESLIRFKDFIGSEVAFYSGHDRERLPDGIVDDLIRGCDEILRGETTADEPFESPYPEMEAEAEDSFTHIISGTKASIVYNINNLA